MPLLDLLIVLSVSALGLFAARLLRAPAIVAYLVAGVAFGPSLLGWVAHTPELEELAELGVALLLFGVGIEFSLEGLGRVAGRMLLAGALQVVATVAVTSLVFSFLGIDTPTAVFVGFLTSLSSTAIVFKLYGESGELDSPQSQAAAGILLFQDLALVPMVLLVPVLAHPGERGFQSAVWALGEAGLALIALFVVARLILPRALHVVARAATPELFAVSAVITAFGAAAAAVYLGLSLPIGAFLAGLALSGTAYAHQVFSELVPLRDVFVAIFFTSIGMLVEPEALFAFPEALIGMVALALLKGLLVALIVGTLWRSMSLGILSGFTLAQLGEFSFVLAHEGLSAGLIDEGLRQPFLAAAVLTMGATPFLMRLGEWLARRQRASARTLTRPELRDHVLVLGYGETGQAIGRVLSETGMPFVILDRDVQRVGDGSREGLPVYFGEASRRPVLEHMGAQHARALVVALGDPTTERRALSLLRQLNPDAPIIARARYVTEIAEFERLGANEVVPSQFETSIEVLARLLNRLGVPRHIVRVQESLIRLDHYRTLRGSGTTPELLAQTEKLVMGGILETAQVMAGSEAVGRTLAELELPTRTGVQILNVVRNEQPQPPPSGVTRLEEGDLVVLYGPHETIERALKILEPRDASESS